MAAELIRQGYEIYRHGWPDFVAVKARGGQDEYRFVKITNGWGLHPNDKTMARILGIHVESWKRGNELKRSSVTVHLRDRAAGGQAEGHDKAGVAPGGEMEDLP